MRLSYTILRNRDGKPTTIEFHLYSDTVRVYELDSGTIPLSQFQQQFPSLHRFVETNNFRDMDVVLDVKERNQ